MGFNNPIMPWSEVERLLSGTTHPRGKDGRAPGSPSWNAGGDGPAWSRKRQPYEPPADPDATQPLCAPGPGARAVRRAALPLQLLVPRRRVAPRAAGRGGRPPRASRRWRSPTTTASTASSASPRRPATVGLPTVFGAEITLTPGRQRPPGAHRGGHPAPGRHRPRCPDTHAARPARPTPRGPRRRPHRLRPPGPGAQPRPPRRGEGGAAVRPRTTSPMPCAGTAGCSPGAARVRCPRRWWPRGPAAAGRELRRLIELFGRDRVLVELWDHGDPLDSVRNDALAELAARHDVGCVATNNVHYATPAQRRLATAVAAVRARRSLDELDPWLPAAAGAHLRSGAEQVRRFLRYPGVVELAAEIGRAAAFDLSLVAPNLPPFPCPTGPDGVPLTRDGSTCASSSRQGAVGATATARPRTRTSPCAPGRGAPSTTSWTSSRTSASPATSSWCGTSSSSATGRTSSARAGAARRTARSATRSASPRPTPCRSGLLFERFLSPERDGPPDIDIDIESDRREEVIQYVYAALRPPPHRAGGQRHHLPRPFGGARHGQGARLRRRPAGRVEQADRRVGHGRHHRRQQPDHDIPEAVLELAAEIEDAPRHLGIHSGGMVICDRPVIEVCPVEWGRMDRRSVLQWDKDDCAAAGLVKFDLLGLGMLTALHYAVDLIREHRGYEVDLATIPQEDDVYAMLCRADTVGVFQIESRAQMATLPRLKPRRFYDLVVEVALIRPGPIQGGSVHPYIRRRNGQEPITYLHPLLENSLGKTLGVPLFQEQLMQMAIDVAGFTPAEADQLRQAMGSKRSRARMERLKAAAVRGDGRAGHHRRGGRRDLREDGRVRQLRLPRESHSCRSPTSSTRRRGSSSTSRPRSARRCSTPSRWGSGARTRCARTPAATVWWCARPTSTRRSRRPRWSRARTAWAGWPCGSGCRAVRGVGSRPRRGDRGRAAVRLAGGSRAARAGARPRRSSRRWPPPGCSSECFGLERREALWAVGAAVQSRPDRLEGIVVGARRAAPAGHGPGGDGGRRPVGHRGGAERASHAVPARASWPRGAWSRPTGCGTASRGAGCWSPVWSPIANGR